ncbi:MAG TPA: hypothetical protein VGC45_03870 [Gryllotalpicola sp.]
MRRLIAPSVLLGIPALGLLVVWFLTRQSGVLIAAVVLFAASGVWVAVAALVVSRHPSGGLVAPHLDAIGGALSDSKAFHAAQASTRVYTGTITGTRSTGAERGVGRFGIELTVEIEDSGGVIDGTVRQFLDPAQLARLTPGARVSLKRAEAYPGMYVIAEPQGAGRPGGVAG